MLRYAVAAAVMVVVVMTAVYAFHMVAVMNMAPFRPFRVILVIE